VSGVVYFAVDPSHTANQGIVDLDKAARGDDGKVHFAAGFGLLAPADANRGNRRLLFHIVNRGRQTVPFNRPAPEPVPTANLDPGDGFLMRHGWTVAWCGWQWDVLPGSVLCGLQAPEAHRDGEPIPGYVSVEFQPNEPHRWYKLDHWPLSPPPDVPHFRHQPYPAADLADPEATLTVRDWPEGFRTLIPRAQWRFARDEGGRPVAGDGAVWLEGGFAPGRIYEVIYRTRRSPVVGAGLLAVRDCVAFLRSAPEAAGNPCAGRIDHTYGFGSSQSGRFLREFVHLGLNVDESGARVFDGLIPHVAGARRGEFNHRFAQPSVQHVPSFGHLPPFADDDQTDPQTGQTDGLLRRQRAIGGVPRIFTVNTSSEYWRSDCSLVHTNMSGTRDVEPPPEVRVYLFAGTQHGPGMLPPTDTAPSGARGANVFNVVDYSPLLRAALVNLDVWVSDGQAPPPSAIPRLADGTAVSRERVLESLAGLPGLVLLSADRLPSLHRIDLGPDAASGVGRFPAQTGQVYPSVVSAVDADGNELAGIRLPDLTVPLATHTGWNPRHPATGGIGQNGDMMGTTLPFSPTREARTRSGDRRHSVGERYASRDDFLSKVRLEATRLAAERYILEEDIDLLVRLAAERWDALVESSPTH
jgi:hypothetical protein